MQSLYLKRERKSSLRNNDADNDSIEIYGTFFSNVIVREVFRKNILVKANNIHLQGTNE